MNAYVLFKAIESAVDKRRSVMYAPSIDHSPDLGFTHMLNGQYAHGGAKSMLAVMTRSLLNNFKALPCLVENPPGPLQVWDQPFSLSSPGHTSMMVTMVTLASSIMSVL